MSCDRFQDDIGRLLAGTAEAGVQAAFEAHLAGCAECRAARASEAQLRAAFATTREIRPSRALQSALLAVPARERRTRALVPLALPTALLICGCGTLAGWLMIPGGGPGNVAQDSTTPTSQGSGPASTDPSTGPGRVTSDRSPTRPAGMPVGNGRPADPRAQGALPAGPAPTPIARPAAAAGVATQIAMGSGPVAPGPGSRGGRRDSGSRSTPGTTPTDLKALTDGPAAGRQGSPTTPTEPGTEPGILPGPSATVDPSATRDPGVLPPTVPTETAAPASPSPSRSMFTATHTPTPMARATQTPRPTRPPPTSAPAPSSAPTSTVGSTPAAPGTVMPPPSPTGMPAAATPTAAMTVTAAASATASTTPTPTATPTPSPTR
jgi:hypothetical protein